MAKKALLRLAKYLGLFWLSSRITQDYLRILCYHGIAVADECRFRPVLFMSCELFEARLKFLTRAGYTPVSLDEGIRRWRAGCLNSSDIVITIDDGWYGTYSCMAPKLAEAGFPATLYVSSYYLEKQVPVFNVAISYILWKAAHDSIDRAQLSVLMNQDSALIDRHSVEQLGEILISHGESLGSAEQRQEFLEKVVLAVGLDPLLVFGKRLLAYMSLEEARSLPSQGIDIQLHTHRHKFPASSLADAKIEVEENRATLVKVSQSDKPHFCYPSGEYTSEQLGWMDELELQSATTTEPGINAPNCSVFELRRILDSQERSEIELQSELSGFMHLARGVRTRMMGSRRPVVAR